MRQRRSEIKPSCSFPQPIRPPLPRQAWNSREAIYFRSGAAARAPANLSNLKGRGGGARRPGELPTGYEVWRGRDSGYSV